MRWLLVHPSGYAAASESCGEAQTGRAHWEVAYQIPHQADELNDGGYQGQKSAPELWVVSWRKMLRNAESQKDGTNETAAGVYKYTDCLHDGGLR